MNLLDPEVLSPAESGMPQVLSNVCWEGGRWAGRQVTLESVYLRAEFPELRSPPDRSCYHPFLSLVLDSSCLSGISRPSFLRNSDKLLTAPAGKSAPRCTWHLQCLFWCPSVYNIPSAMARERACGLEALTECISLLERPKDF